MLDGMQSNMTSNKAELARVEGCYLMGGCLYIIKKALLKSQLINGDTVGSKTYQQDSLSPEYLTVSSSPYDCF